MYKSIFYILFYFLFYFIFYADWSSVVLFSPFNFFYRYLKAEEEILQTVFIILKILCLYVIQLHRVVRIISLYIYKGAVARKILKYEIDLRYGKDNGSY